MSAVPLPCRETGKEKVFYTRIQIVFLPEGGPYSGPSKYIPGLCVGEGRVVISQLCWDPPGCQMCPSWQQGY